LISHFLRQELVEIFFNNQVIHALLRAEEKLASNHRLEVAEPFLALIDMLIVETEELLSFGGHLHHTTAES